MKFRIFLIIFLTTCSVFSQIQDVVVATEEEYKELKSKTIIDSSDTRILKLLDNLFNESLQSDENSITEETVNLYKMFNEAGNIPNEHLFFLFTTYQYFVSEATRNPKLSNPDLQLWLINTLSEEMDTLFGVIPKMVAIYKGESLLATGQKSEAIKHFAKFIAIYPNAIPIKVYRFQLESDFTKKEIMYNELKTKHTNHWMVKGL